VDSNIWIAQLVRTSRPVSEARPIQQEADSLAEEEVAEWVDTFGTSEPVDLDRELVRALLAATKASEPDEHPDSKATNQPEPPARDPDVDIDDELLDGLANPFPPGYAEDLLDEDDI
jgi:hypothetical protein